MKVIIATDFLIERDDATLYMDLLVSMYPKAQLMTLSHQEGKILGEIEMRTITSSFLSHKIKEPKDIARYYYLIPEALKALVIPEETDLVISFSRGFIHGLNIPTKTKHLVFYYDRLNVAPKGFFKFLGMHTDYFLQKKEEQIKHWYKPAKYCFKTADFPMPHPDQQFTHDFYVLNAENCDENNLAQTLNVLEKLKVAVKIVGENATINSLRDIFIGHSQFEFWGKRCNGDLASLLVNAKAVIDLTSMTFPHKAFAALSVGRPVLISQTPKNQEWFSDKVIYLDPKNTQDLEQKIKQMESDYKHAKSLDLRRFALHFNERAFKSDFSRTVKELVNLEAED